MECLLHICKSDFLDWKYSSLGIEHTFYCTHPMLRLNCRFSCLLSWKDIQHIYFQNSDANLRGISKVLLCCQIQILQARINMFLFHNSKIWGNDKQHSFHLWWRMVLLQDIYMSWIPCQFLLEHCTSGITKYCCSIFLGHHKIHIHQWHFWKEHF